MTHLHFKRPPLIASVLALSGCAVLCGLGTWQMQKYIAKTGLRNSPSCIDARVQPSEVSNGYNKLLPDPCGFLQVLSGTLHAQTLIPIGPRTNKGDIGYHLYAPLKAEDGTQILVNLGWSPDKAPTLSNFAAIIEGHIITPSGPNSFTPENKPETQEWYGLSVAEISAHYGLENISDAVIFAQNINPAPQTPLVPAELSRSYLTPEMHLQYAAFWYFMALALSIIFILRFMIIRK